MEENISLLNAYNQRDDSRKLYINDNTGIDSDIHFFINLKSNLML